MKVLFYHRKPRPLGNYSLEAIFQDVRNRLPMVESTVRVAPYWSNGLFRRLAIVLDAAVHQSEINHVTGDINFAALLMSPRRTVLTILDCIDVESKRGWKGWLFRKIWFEWPARRSAIITTISQAAKKDIVRFTGCPPDKVVVTGVAISPRFQLAPRPFRYECPRILQVGTAHNKNIESLAAALAGIPCRLVVVGELNPSQSDAIARHQIPLENHRRLDDEAMRQEYIDADIIAFASTFEGFGMPILEGNATGRPVVTSDCASMPEVAGNAACLVNPFDVASIRAGFLRIIQDEAYRTMLVQNGLQNVRRFDPDAIAQRYLDVYQQLASRGTNR